LNIEKACRVNILVINASPRKKSNTQVLVDEAVKGIEEVSDGTAKIFKLAGKRINPCKGVCSNHCRTTGNCIQDDDFHEFANLWIRADGIIYATPLYHMGVPSSLRAAIERLGHIFFVSCEGKYLRFCKAGGVIAQGNTQYGGQEFAMQEIIAHLILMKCIPVSGDMPNSYMGVGAQASCKEDLEKNEVAKESARSLGRRVSEMAKILKFGIKGLKKYLPSDYFYDREREFAPLKKSKKE